MSTDTTADIFYQVKKEILDKLDIILQKVNLQIINSRHFNSIQGDSNFTFIQLSNFESEISSLFLYLDKLYQSLNSSVSGYTSQAHHTNPDFLELQEQNEKLELQNKAIKKKTQKLEIQNETIKKKAQKLEIQNEALKKQVQKLNRQIVSISQKIIKQQSKNTNNNINKKQVKQKLNQLLNILHHESQQVNLLKKQISSKLKQFKFQMLQTRVQILSKIKENECFWKQSSIRKQDAQVNCHHISHDQFQIINELNQILKMC